MYKKILIENKFKDVAYKNEYYPKGSGLEKVKVGDVIIYGDLVIEPVKHSGFVSRIEENKIYITSKWDTEGKVEHLIEDVPEDYGKYWTIYHTDRKGGRLLSETYEEQA